MSQNKPQNEENHSWEKSYKTDSKNKLGAYLRFIRKLGNHTQTDAAKRAGITRQQWNRIENGHDLPRASSIPVLADALDLAPSALYKRAGYPIPKYELIYNEKNAIKDLKYALKRSESLAGFLLRMESVWQEYQKQQLELKQRTYLDVNYANVLSSVLTCLNPLQQLRLAKALTDRILEANSVEFKPQAQELYDAIDIALEKLR